ECAAPRRFTRYHSRRGPLGPVRGGGIVRCRLPALAGGACRCRRPALTHAPPLQDRQMNKDAPASPGHPDDIAGEGAGESFAAYSRFEREEWAALRSSTPLTLSQQDLVALQGFNEKVSLTDVVEIYLPLSRLLNLHIRSARNLNGVKDEFLGRLVGARPYVIGIAGSVAVGKSTFARILQALLARWPDHPRVALVTTDGFLYPNQVLEERGLMQRKGFPESYDRRRMLQFLAD